MLVVVLAGCASGGARVETKTEAPVTAAPSVEASTAPTEAPSPRSRAVPQWCLLLVNPWNPLPEDFSVELGEVEGLEADARICRDLAAMLADARAEGLCPVVCSAYRSRETQRTLYANKIQRLLAAGCGPDQAPALAAQVVAVPGTSEHEAGLAVDIASESYRVLDEDQAGTPEQRWLMANAHRYGFILRYPADKTGITGIVYEPWHYRYVGRQAATEIYEQGLCLEEYLGA